MNVILYYILDHSTDSALPDFDSRFQHIGLIAKPGDASLAPTLRKLHRFLIDMGLKVSLARSAALALEQKDYLPSKAELARICDLAIVVGGDGSLLNAAREIADEDTPLVGINLGRLGFLVDISPERMVEALTAILRGDYIEDQRFLLEARIGDAQRQLALNDVVLHKWNSARMIEFETRINGRYVDSQRSDGIIISTPTGSTAYALSGGGPLLEPSLDAIALVPICPHRLSNRPIVVHGDSEICIETSGRTDTKHVRITCDGQSSLSLEPGEQLSVRKYPRPIRLFHPVDHDHFDLLRAKLGWGGHP
ncbi:NAD(+) kinase [Thiolapillus sp.]